MTHRHSLSTDPHCAWRVAAAWMMLLPAVVLPGCVRVLAIGAKVFAGDPKESSAFALQTGLPLEDGDHVVALVVEVPHFLSDDFSSLADDLQAELALRFERHGIALADADDVVRALERSGRDFSADQLARELDVQCIVRVQMEQFTDRHSGSSSLLQSQARGQVTGYEIRGEFGTAERHAVEVYEQPFATTYPGGQPLPVEQMPQLKFVQNTIRHVADVVGRQFYEVQTSSLY